jgi:hypothetical protein
MGSRYNPSQPTRQHVGLCGGCWRGWGGAKSVNCGRVNSYEQSSIVLCEGIWQPVDSEHRSLESAEVSAEEAPPLPTTPSARSLAGRGELQLSIQGPDLVLSCEFRCTWEYQVRHIRTDSVNTGPEDIQRGYHTGSNYRPTYIYNLEACQCAVPSMYS